MVCILNHPFASLRVEDDSVKITGVLRTNAPVFDASVYAALRRAARYLSGITPRHLGLRLPLNALSTVRAIWPKIGVQRMHGLVLPLLQTSFHGVQLP